MAKRTGLTRTSDLFSLAGFLVDGYNGIKYDAKDRNLVYLSLALSALGTLIDFYISLKSPHKLRKLGALISFVINVMRLATSFRKVKEDF